MVFNGARKNLCKFLSFLIVSVKGKLQTQLRGQLIFPFCLFSFSFRLSLVLSRRPPPLFLSAIAGSSSSALFTSASFHSLCADSGRRVGGGPPPCQVNPICVFFPPPWRAWRSTALLCLNPSVKLGCNEAQTCVARCQGRTVWCRTTGPPGLHPPHYYVHRFQSYSQWLQRAAFFVVGARKTPEQRE